MKNTIRVNIAGLAFALTDEAYARLDPYIASLQAHYAKHDQKNEIIEGIEERIAEWFLSKKSDSGTINLNVVEEVISILGTPENIEGETPAESFVRDTDIPLTRKLYRDPNQKWIGGVFSGMAHYLGIRPLFVRLALVVLFIAVSEWSTSLFHIDFDFITLLGFTLIYFILCSVIPVAKTVQEQWEMMGEAGDIDAIRQRANPHMASRNRSCYPMQTADSLFGRIVVACLKLLGLLLMVIGISALTGILFTFFFFRWSEGLSWIDLLKIVQVPHAAWVFTLLVTVCVLPFIALLYQGAKWLFRFKGPRWKPLVMLGLLFVLSCTALSFIVYPGAKNYAQKRSFTYNDYSLANVNTDTLQIDLVYPEGISADEYKPVSWGSDDPEEKPCLFINKKNQTLVFFPQVNIEYLDSPAQEPYAQYHITAFKQKFPFGNKTLSEQMPSYRITNQKVMLYGKLIHKDQPWNRQIEQIELHLSPKTRLFW